MEDLTKLTKKIRAEGLTDNIRSEIRAAHKKLTEANAETIPASDASADSGKRENNTLAAHAARDSMFVRSSGSDREGILYGHGEKYTSGEVSIT